MPHYWPNHHCQSEGGSRIPNMPGETEGDKNYGFEKFIVNKLHRDRYRLMYWRKDKFTERNYVVSGVAPDLIYEYRDQSKTIGFAVACVWRGCYVNGSVAWARGRQIKSYYDFQFREGIDVFIMIGIGNIPSDPAELYIVPLNHIPLHKTSLHFDFLKQYKRSASDNMFSLNVGPMFIE